MFASLLIRYLQGGDDSPFILLFRLSVSFWISLWFQTCTALLRSKFPSFCLIATLCAKLMIFSSYCIILGSSIMDITGDLPYRYLLPGIVVCTFLPTPETSMLLLKSYRAPPRDFIFLFGCLSRNVRGSVRSLLYDSSLGKSRL